MLADVHWWPLVTLISRLLGDSELKQQDDVSSPAFGVQRFRLTAVVLNECGRPQDFDPASVEFAAEPVEGLPELWPELVIDDIRGREATRDRRGAAR